MLGLRLGFSDKVITNQLHSTTQVFAGFHEPFRQALVGIAQSPKISASQKPDQILHHFAGAGTVGLILRFSFQQHQGKEELIGEFLVGVEQFVGQASRSLRPLGAHLGCLDRLCS